MHHRNFKHSSANHNNPPHYQPRKSDYPSQPAPQTRKTSILRKISERFKEKPATPEEVGQLRLNTIREELKTRKQIAKTKRPSRMAAMFGEPKSGPSYRRGSGRNQEDVSWMFGGGEKSSFGGGMFESNSKSPGFSMFQDTAKQGKKNQKSGIEDLFT